MVRHIWEIKRKSYCFWLEKHHSGVSIKIWRNLIEKYCSKFCTFSMGWLGRVQNIWLGQRMREIDWETSEIWVWKNQKEEKNERNVFWEVPCSIYINFFVLSWCMSQLLIVHLINNRKALLIFCPTSDKVLQQTVICQCDHQCDHQCDCQNDCHPVCQPVCHPSVWSSGNVTFSCIFKRLCQNFQSSFSFIYYSYLSKRLHSEESDFSSKIYILNFLVTIVNIQYGKATFHL